MEVNLLKKDMDFFSDFQIEKCNICGKCFNECPVLKLPIDESIAEMKRILAGNETKVVLQKCQSCFYCNLICPNGANPAQLILHRWYQYYQKNGLPMWAKYYNTLDNPNFRSYTLAMRGIPKDERKLYEKWKNLDPVKGTYCYPGCNVYTAAYLTETSLFKDLEIRYSLDFCCGETFYRTGLFDQVKDQTQRLNKYFNKLGVKDMVVLCTAGTNVFKNILPRFGAKFDFPIKSYLDYLWEKIENGEILKILTRVIGRQYDMARLPNGEIVTFLEFNMIMNKYESIKQFKIIQKEADVFEVLIASESDYFEQIILKVENDLNNISNQKLIFDIKNVPTIPADPNGKLKTLVSKII